MAMFTASRAQIATYLLGVCPFSIAFLVFLNSSISFIVTDLVGREEGIGDVVGNLGFADELVALIACPVWGLLSDRIGVRSVSKLYQSIQQCLISQVCCLGYIIIGIALYIIVQAKNVYPELLLFRLLFSLGGAAASTMVTAILPTMSYVDEHAVDSFESSDRPFSNRHAATPSAASELTITPNNYLTARSQYEPHSTRNEAEDATSKIAGFVGMATGCGALVALSLFLPLPARFQKDGIPPGPALQYSYYIVGGIAIALALICLFGLRGLKSEEKRPSLFQSDRETSPSWQQAISSSASSLYHAFLAGFVRSDILIGYIGGFVARASSVGISLFVPLLVNAAFLSSDLCKPAQTFDRPAGLPEIKRQCPRAYVVAAELTGVSQLIALLCAPLFGYWGSRITNKNIPLMFSAVAGIIGYPLFASRFDPNDQNSTDRVVAFLAVSLIGLSQIGAIVASLGILSNGMLGHKALTVPRPTDSVNQENATEDAPLLGTQNKSTSTKNLAEIKGSVAGIYSFYGGAGILILTKAGGALFDSATRSAPFYLMASFNAVLLLATSIASLRGRNSKNV